jgi:hypothetical protein
MDTLIAGGLTLPLTDPDAPFGPSIAPSSPEAAILSWAVGQLPDLAERLERGEEVSDQAARVRRPASGEELSAHVARWRELTGQDLGDDVMIVDARVTRRSLALPRLALLAIERALQERRLASPRPPAPWLFTPRVLSTAPAPAEDALLRDLEARAAALDRTPPPTTPPEAATQVVKRRTLLAEIDAHGLFARPGGDERIAWLERWNLSTLLSYALAAVAMRRYLASPERTERFAAPDRSSGDEPILGARVSIDWFRAPPPPPEGMTPFQWLAHCEHCLIVAEPLTGGAGEVFTGFGARGPLFLQWRRDDGEHPALVRAQLGL